MANKIKVKINEKLEDLRFANAMSIAASLNNKETFSDIKGCNSGKEVVLCGAGPTLKKYKPIEGALHVALNRALLNDAVHYDWFIADDWDGVDFFKDELEKYDCLKFFGHQILNRGVNFREIPESYRIKSHARRYYTDSYMINGFNSRFICDIDKMAIGNMPNIALSAMQIVLFSNPKTIYIVGCDASKGHFIQPKNITSEQVDRQEKDLKMAVSGDRTIQKWLELRDFAKTFYSDTEIVSINPVGLKGIFKDIYTE